jgi:hypothetical protein
LKEKLRKGLPACWHRFYRETHIMKALVTAFLSELVAIDLESAKKMKDLGCPECKSTLHKANFIRKFRGLEVEIPPQFEIRFSFCCSKDGCRNRLTPPSVRFMRHKVYLSLVILLISSGVETFLEEKLEVSTQTLSRWRKVWSQILSPSNPLYLRLKAFLPTDMGVNRTPHPILQWFLNQPQIGIVDGIRNALLLFQKLDLIYLRVP